MKATRLKVLAVALLLAGVATVGISQTTKPEHMHGDGMSGRSEFGGPGFGGPGFGGHMFARLIHELDLTDEQQAKAKEIMTKEKSTMQPLMLQMAQNHRQLNQLIMDSGFNEAKVRQMASQQTQAMTELMVQGARVESEMLEILTPEQKTKLATLMTEHEQKMMKHMQEHQQPDSQ